MQDFVILFRQTRPLDQNALNQRAAATRPWAAAANAAGHALRPHILGPARRCMPDAAEAEVPLTALLFLQAASLDAAFALACSHPAVVSGAEIEVRPWSAPSAA